MIDSDMVGGGAILDREFVEDMMVNILGKRGDGEKEEKMERDANGKAIERVMVLKGWKA